MFKSNHAMSSEPDVTNEPLWIPGGGVPLPRPQDVLKDKQSVRYALPHTELLLDGLDQRQRMDAWRGHFSGLFDVGLHDVAQRDFDASASAVRIGQSVLGRYSVTDARIRRTQKNLKLEREDLLVLRVHLSGATNGVMNDTSFKMRQDRLTLFDFHQDYNGQEDDVEFISLTFPYEAIGYDPSRHPRLMQLPSASPIGRTILNNIAWLFEAIPMSTVDETVSLSDGFIGLMRGLVTRDFHDETAFQASMRAREIAVRRYIDENLRDPSLDAQQICEAIGVSRPVLFRMFSEEGGLQRSITQKRLDRILDDLAVSVPERGAISRISKHWGYFDQAHFTRLFRNAFGFKPGDALGSALAMQTSGESRTTERRTEAVPRLRRLAEIYS
ncbi:AraC-like ligand-binding domain-containing protein [Gymnodinialimonas sp.]